MDALVIHSAGDLRIEDRPAEVPAAGQLLVRLRYGGICGSDLHYYLRGGFGTVRLREPMVLGHEVSGAIQAVGPGVTGFSAGDLVAVSPSRPCGRCRYCLEGRPNHCLNMRYYGSAMPMPHIQGAFRQQLVIDAAQARRLTGKAGEAEGVLAEPLSVALHAVVRAGSVFGRNILVTGCGPIGALCIIAARRAGARRITATDIAPYPLKIARAVGADETINLAEQPQGLAAYGADKGTFDVLFEASGNEKALRGAFDALRPRSVIVQLGLGGEMAIPMNTIVTKEFDLRGTFRFHEEFYTAVDMLNQGLVDVKPLISAVVPYREFARGFTLAGDRAQAMKVLLDFA